MLWYADVEFSTQSVTRAIKNFPGFSQLQVFAIAALGNLCSTSGSRAAMDAQGKAAHFVSKFDGVLLDTNAMGSFPGNKKRQEIGT
jgi:hypothetical protein